MAHLGEFANTHPQDVAQLPGFQLLDHLCTYHPPVGNETNLGQSESRPTPDAVRSALALSASPQTVEDGSDPTEEYLQQSQRIYRKDESANWECCILRSNCHIELTSQLPHGFLKDEVRNE